MAEVGRRKDNTFDVVHLFAAACLFLAPWVLGFAAEPSAAWTAWLTAAAIALVAAAAISAHTGWISGHAGWEEWVALALGIWAIVSPWAVGFASVTVATWTHVVIGLVVAVLAAAELWSDRDPSRHVSA